jgi:NDP-sugar pyrophosphorylase family protein
VKYDINLTVPEDLLQINLTELSRQKRKNIVGDAVDMPDGTRIENCVIGSGAKFVHPIAISNSMIFPNSVVQFNTDTDSVIVHGDKVVYCNPPGGD